MNSDPGTIKLRALVAMASNRVIGRNGKLPWHLPEDLRWFKKTTLDHPILMGRKTFDSLPGLLPRRRHIVLSRSLSAPPDGVELIHSIDELDSLNLEGDVFVVGGAAVYELLLPRCTDLFLSFIHEPHEGDAFFPPFENNFTFKEILATYPEFELRHYLNRKLEGGAPSPP